MAKAKRPKSRYALKTAARVRGRPRPTSPFSDEYRPTAAHRLVRTIGGSLERFAEEARERARLRREDEPVFTDD